MTQVSEDPGGPRFLDRSGLDDPVPLTVEAGVTCSTVVDRDGDDGDTGPCGRLSRFLVERSDRDGTYGINGGSDEACEEHLAESVAGMIDGDAGITAVVTIRWDRAGG